MTDLRLAYDSATRGVETELRYLWDGLTANERRVIASVGSGLSPYRREAQAMTGLTSRSTAERAVTALEGRAILERSDAGPRHVVDPLLARWVRLHGGARRSVFVVPHPNGGYAVTDGPSLAFARSQHRSLPDAEAEADRLAAREGGADVMIFDTDRPNELPGWAVSAAESGG
jgi:hypothetical protein